MDCKINRLLPFLILSILLFTGCRKKPYEYSNIQSKDVLSSGEQVQVAKDLPILKGNHKIIVEYDLDKDGCQKLLQEINERPDTRIHLDLHAAQVPAGSFRDVRLPDGFFSGLKNLVSVILPDCLLTISKDMFRDCVSLSTLTLPERLTAIEGGAFSGCVSLKQINASDQGIYIFSYSGDGLEYPLQGSPISAAQVNCGDNVLGYKDWYTYCWNFGKAIEPKPVTFAGIKASSSQSGYGPENLSDGTWNTWFEAEPDGGIGTEIFMQFTRRTPVSTITFRNGNGNTENYWKTNRVKLLDIYFGNEKVPLSIMLEDTMESQTFKFLYGYRKLAPYDSVRMVIKSVYPGDGSDETGIAEISINCEPDYHLDPYSEELERSFNSLIQDERLKKRIWREKDSDPVMISYIQDDEAGNVTSSDFSCFVYRNGQWQDAIHSVGKNIKSVFDKADELGLKTVFSFYEMDADEQTPWGDYDFMVQMMRPVELLPDAPYAKPWFFNFKNGIFSPEESPSLNYERIETDVKNFETMLYSLDENGLYNVVLTGQLDREFFNTMHQLLPPDTEFSKNKNMNLDMSRCTFSPELLDTIGEGDIRGYYNILTLPSSTKGIERGAITVAAKKIVIPSSVQKIEPGAFVAGNGSLYDYYASSIQFVGNAASSPYQMNGDLLLEKIPDTPVKRVILYCGGKTRSDDFLVIPDDVEEISPYSFYSAEIGEVIFPREFTSAGEHCFDFMKTYRIDLSKCDVSEFDLTTVRQFGTLVSSNSDIQLEGNLLCVTANGKMTDFLIQQIEDELNYRTDKIIYLDLSNTVLQVNDKAQKFQPLPDFFLYNHPNLQWLTLGQYNYIPSNTCRDCSNLKWVQFIQEPEKIASPAFKGTHANAVAVVNGKSFGLWSYAQSLN